MAKPRMAAAIDPIKRGEIYLKDLLCGRAGWGNHAFRAARRAGLKTIRVHGRCYISGDAFHDYVSALERDERDTALTGDSNS